MPPPTLLISPPLCRLGLVPRSETETPEVVRMKTYLAGNLDSVAIEMSHRYRGRNKSVSTPPPPPPPLLSLLFDDVFLVAASGVLLSIRYFVAQLQSAQD
jgi:hypothetical protein